MTYNISPSFLCVIFIEKKHVYLKQKLEWEQSIIIIFFALVIFFLSRMFTIACKEKKRGEDQIDVTFFFEKNRQEIPFSYYQA
jgi:hypothetical protein